MSRILTFTSGPQDWQQLLADPAKHWRTGYSARTLAHSWEATDGFPPEIKDALDTYSDPPLGGITPILAVPEFKVDLPGGSRPSQNDLFVLARSKSGPVSIMVEGKVSESFGPTLGEWRLNASAGKKQRLKYLLNLLSVLPSDDIRYQLLHRAASAIIVAEQYRAVASIMLVHSFCLSRTGWSDYEAFLSLFGVQAVFRQLQLLSTNTSVPLFAAWVPGDSFYLNC